MTALLRLLLRQFNLERKTMATLADLSAAVSKIGTDIDTKLAADAATITALNAQVADLQAQLAALQNDQATIDQAVTDLGTADAKLA